jgi:hypothetical protein
MKPSFGLRWAAACGIGELIGVTFVAGVAVALNRAFGEPESLWASLLVLPVMVAAGAVEGLSLGYFQWRVLRARFPDLAARQWVGVTCIAAAGGWLLGMLPPAVLEAGSTIPEPAISDTFFLVMLLGLGVGILFGAVQAWVLRRHAARAGRWIVANALGWSVAMPWVFLAATLPDEATPLPAIIALAAASGLAAGLSLGAITGRWLIRL